MVCRVTVGVATGHIRRAAVDAGKDRLNRGKYGEQKELRRCSATSAPRPRESMVVTMARNGNSHRERKELSRALQLRRLWSSRWHGVERLQQLAGATSVTACRVWTFERRADAGSDGDDDKDTADDARCSDCDRGRGWGVTVGLNARAVFCSDCAQSWID